MCQTQVEARPGPTATAVSPEAAAKAPTQEPPPARIKATRSVMDMAASFSKAVGAFEAEGRSGGTLSILKR